MKYSDKGVASTIQTKKIDKYLPKIPKITENFKFILYVLYFCQIKWR